MAAMVTATDTPKITHGTLGGYNNHACRCEECRRANRLYQTRYRAARKRRSRGETFERSYAQRLAALEKGNAIRSKRAKLKRDMKEGRVRAASLLVSPPEWIETMKVFDLLLAIPKWGRVKVSGRLKQCGISPSKRVGGLSARQRDDLVRRMPDA